MPADRNLSVVVYSQHAELRSAVRTSVGRRAGDLGRIDWTECAAYTELRNELDAGDVDLVLLDGDAQPTGGIGLARQFKNEITNCPPMIVIVARHQDRWLASWSTADAVLVRPIDPVQAAETVVGTLRARAAVIHTVR